MQETKTSEMPTGQLSLLSQDETVSGMVNISKIIESDDPNDIAIERFLDQGRGVYASANKILGLRPASFRSIGITKELPIQQRTAEATLEIIQKTPVDSLRTQLQNAYDVFRQDHHKEMMRPVVYGDVKADIRSTVIFIYMPTNGEPPRKITLREAEMILNPEKANLCMHYLQGIISGLSGR